MSNRTCPPRWHEACKLVLQETDPIKLLPLYEDAVARLEGRFATLNELPETEEEIYSIRKTIVALLIHSWNVLHDSKVPHQQQVFTVRP